MVQETSLRVDQLVFPMDVLPGMDKSRAMDVTGLAGFSVDQLHRVIRELQELGIRAVYLYGTAEQRDEEGSEAYSAAGSVQRAVRAIKHGFPDMVVMTDVCLSRYTDHGHCGIFEVGVVHNDATLDVLRRIALSHAGAGADFVAPTDMMDGRVMAMREALEEEHFEDVGIIAGSVVYASAFNDAAGAHDIGNTEEGNRLDRATYRMNPANALEALREVALDIEEGADIVMVSPAIVNLDIIRRVKETFQVPVAALSSDVETLMIKAAANQGVLDERRAVLESLLAQVRAGADLLITPYAKQAAEWLA